MLFQISSFTKYQGDAKYTRIHKRILEQSNISESERRIYQALSGVKIQADNKVLQNSQMLDNESYFSRLMMPIAIAEFKKKQNINLDLDSFRYINDLLVREYLNEFHNTEFGA